MTAEFRRSPGWFKTAAVLARALSAIDPKYPAAARAARDEMTLARAELEAELVRPQGVPGHLSAAGPDQKALPGRSPASTIAMRR